jgi:hypothetical protein
MEQDQSADFQRGQIKKNLKHNLFFIYLLKYMDMVAINSKFNINKVIHKRMVYILMYSTKKCIKYK